MAQTETSKVLTDFEKGLKLLHASKYKEAIGIFEKLIAGKELENQMADRARVYRNICQEKLSPPEFTPKSFDDFVDLAVLHFNRRELEQSAEYLTKAAKLDGNQAIIHYLTALIECQRANHEAAQAALKKAIEATPELQIRARNDQDFAAMREMNTFRKLVGLEERK